jgi:integrase/recombinase XerD
VLEAQIQDFLTSLAAQSSYSKSTLAAYSSDLRIFWKYLQSSLQRSPELADFTVENVQAFFEAEKTSGRQGRTLLRRRASLQRFEKHLLAAGRLAAAPLVGLNKHSDSVLFKAAASGPEVLSQEQVESLLAAVTRSPRLLSQRDHAILALLLETGLSVSQLIALDLSDLDLRAGSLHLVDNHKEDCWFSIGSALGPMQCYVNVGRPELHPSTNEPALFISQNGVRMSRQSVWQVLQHWGKMARLDTALSPRLLRHTAAVRMGQAGRSNLEIQVLLGHRNPLSTQALLQRLKGEPYETENAQTGESI